MFTRGALLVLLLLSVTSRQVTAAEEHWESATVEGSAVGYRHTILREPAGRGGRQKSSADLNLTFRRNNATVQVRMEYGTEENLDGKVVGVFMRQYQGVGCQVSLVGTLENGQLHFVVDGGRIDRRIPWREDVLGLAKQEGLFERLRPAAGDRFTFFAYEPTVTAVVTVRAVVKAPEAGGVGLARKMRLRVELSPDKLEVRDGTIQLPKTVLWLDESYHIVRRQTEMAGLGLVTLTSTTREAALGACSGPGRNPDLGAKSLVPLGRRIADPYSTRDAVYRVTLRGDSDPATAFSRDAHQEVLNIRGNTFDLHVHPTTRGTGGTRSEAPEDECLGSSYYLDAADSRVRDLARLAIGGEPDPWQRALRIERWVHKSMRVDNAASFVPASRVARSLRGDCRSYAVLTAALCRAADVPARTAVGLLYMQGTGGGQLGFHMWTEVWVDGQWLGLDGTLGLGKVSATHLKIADHSWEGARSLTPLLPVDRVLGKMTVEVLRVGKDD